MRLQDTYRLDTTKLADGVLNGKFYGPQLSAQDCFEIGRQTYNNGDYFHTNIWMEEALRKYEAEEDKSVQKENFNILACLEDKRKEISLVKCF